MEINKILRYISCPVCNSNLQLVNKNNLSCIKHDHKFPIIKGIPVLLQKNKLDKQEANQTVWFDRHYSKFKNTYHLENWRLSMLNRIFNHSFTKSINTYLDVGCGATGYTTIEAAKQKNWLSFGIDISLEAMVKASHHAKQNKVSDQTAFIVASAQNLPFKKNTFDYISLVSVLEHLENDLKAVTQIKNILKKHKYLFVCVPNAYHKILPIIWPFYYYNDIKIGHKRHYSINSLNRLFKGFTPINHFYNGHLIKFLQLFLSKLKFLNDNLWWKIEKTDVNNNQTGVQLNAIYQKT